MTFDKLKEYITNKGDKLNQLERIILKAFEDEEYLSNFINLDFLLNDGKYQNIILNPFYIDKGGVYEQNYYEILNIIATSFTSYLYDEKGKYTHLKSKVTEIEEKINEAHNHIDNIEKTSNLIEGAEILETYSEEFKKRSDKYLEEANSWKDYLIYSFILFGIIFILLLFINIINIDWIKNYIAEDLLYYGYITAIIIKAIIVIVIIQLIRFCYRNYNANMHLSQQSLHKYDVLRSLRGIYNTLAKENKEARDELIKTGAIVAFQNIESGYITTKEGAGNTDSGLNSIIASILKK